MPSNVFVLGLDLLNFQSLLSLAEGYRFHRLLSIEELQEGEDIPFSELLGQATRQLETFDGSVDAIVGYWDFPISSMVPILAERFGLPGAPLTSVVKCEHKYWARLEQRKVTDAHPRFTVVDPDDDAEFSQLDLRPPYWIKPVKAFSSELAFRIDTLANLRVHLREVRDKLDRIAAPFEDVLSRIELPAEIAELGARVCVAEEAATGEQVTVEGFRAEPDTEVCVYGVVDSVPHPEVRSFERFQYPSQIPQRVQDRMVDIADRVIGQVGLAWSTFNIEFFWDPDTDALTILEINPRHSQSHAKLFEYVDGMANHKHMVDLGLGRRPQLTDLKGPYALAAKWFRRHLTDGVVTRSPTAEEVTAAERAVPGITVHLIADEGDRLSRLPEQDSYSYKIAEVYVGANDEAELRDKYERSLERLPFEIDDEPLM